ncbi:hypothetical protein MLD38_016397 [Melastoma candidum]|uniref:Uncharacterized protein n=1 Tax=Melastoma candidum TaxID=119954 RepID=A0ACB9RIW4_9MYRT|nr:hypothetical protein MLD38_016397 [Melastoma candidum]
MALRFSPSSPAHATPSSGATPAPAQPPSGIRFLSASSSRQLHRYGPRPGGRPQRPFVVSCTVDAAVVNIGQVTEVNKDSFWPIVRAAGDKAVVLDMYTQWCGPCKVMAPKFQELSQKYTDVVFLKLDCNQDNKPLAKELGIKVVPTFKILKDAKVVKEVTGAKFDDLVLAIETVRSS